VVLLVVMIVFVMCMVEGGRRLGRLRLGVVFEGVGRTQRCAFQAHCAPNKLPIRTGNRLFLPQTDVLAAVQGKTSPLWPGRYLISW